MAGIGIVQRGERFLGREPAALQIGQDRAPPRAAAVLGLRRRLGRIAERRNHFVEPRAHGRVGDAEFPFDVADNAAVLDKDLDEIDLRAGELEERRQRELAVDERFRNQGIAAE